MLGESSVRASPPHSITANMLSLLNSLCHCHAELAEAVVILVPREFLPRGAEDLPIRIRKWRQLMAENHTLQSCICSKIHWKPDEIPAW